MIKLLGKKVVTFIVLLLALDAGIFVGYDRYLLPVHLEQKQKLDATKAAVEARRAEVQKMKEELCFRIEGTMVGLQRLNIGCCLHF